jgi:hypothetical protein
MQDRGTEQEYCPFNRRGWEIDPRIETAIGYAQVLRKPEHEAEGGYCRIEVVSMRDYAADSQLFRTFALTDANAWHGPRRRM